MANVFVFIPSFRGSITSTTFETGDNFTFSPDGQYLVFTAVPPRSAARTVTVVMDALSWAYCHPARLGRAEVLASTAAGCKIFWNMNI